MRAARPRCEDLRGVVPIGLTRKRDAIAVTILSLESYSDGFVIHFWVGGGPAVFKSASLPSNLVPATEVRLEIEDNAARRYHSIFLGGGGSDQAWRLRYVGNPSLDSATELTIRIAEIRVRHEDPFKAVPDEKWVGPWEFRVDLGSIRSG